jgi:hypothetical protein
MEQSSPVRHRLAIGALGIPLAGDRTRRIIVIGLLGTFALVVLQVAAQAIDFAVFDLEIRGINSDTHHSLFGIASLLAQMAVATACLWRGSRIGRERGAWFVLGALVGCLVIIRGLATFNATTLVAPLMCLFALACWLTWRDRLAVRTVVWAGLLLMAASFLLHKVGLAADGSAASQHTWPYQITSMVKHGAELAGWLLLATGIAAGIARSVQEVTPDRSLLLEMESVSPSPTRPRSERSRVRGVPAAPTAERPHGRRI